ncbi:MAG: EAL domain-containing protein [Gammaproteobacteria bacterium]|nr:EAL domain-containing protein [Gammaproteobacteria bacterium]MBA3731164.1 EAL domain-containing protein [Gammaproteobacteria bacterium]
MILDQSFNEIYIFDANTLRFTYANAGACRNLQYSLEELKRLTVADVKPEFTVREYARLLEPLRSGRNAVVVLETVHQRKNGTRYPVDVRVQLCRTEQGPSFICIMNDVTERREIQEALFHEKELADVTLEAIGDAVIAIDKRGDVIFLNRMAAQLTGWSKIEAKGLPFTTVCNIFYEETRRAVEIPLAEVAATGDTASLPDNIMLMSSLGAQYPIDASVAPIRATGGVKDGALVIFRDVTATRTLVRELAHQAGHDALTALLNRREFERKAEHLLASAKATGEQHALLFLDLDHFKLVNDRCGHLAGDEFLRQISSLLLSRMNKCDTLARLGGDEFGALLERRSLEEARAFAESLLQAVEDYRYSSPRGLLSVGVSIGLVPVTAQSRGLKNMLCAADSACYLAKEKGGDRVQLFQRDDVDVLSRKRAMDWVSDVHSAMDEDRFCLFFQRIAPLDPAHHVGGERFEVLLRMRDTHGGIISPLDFILAAERYSAITAIDCWVIKTVFEHLRQQTTRIEDHGTPLPLWSINVSGISIGDMRFLDFIREQFERFALPPESICFELTETAAITNFDQAMRFVDAIKTKGCAFALDDFGSGLSSFSHLKGLPVDMLKIDGAFIRGMADDPVDYAVVDSICRIARVMGADTVAEYVENDHLLNIVREIGVQYVQGAAIHKAEPLLPANRGVAPAARQAARSVGAQETGVRRKA